MIKSIIISALFFLTYKANADIINQIHPNSLIQADYSKFIILNKITAKSSLEMLNIGEEKEFGNLSIKLNKCIKNTDPFDRNDFLLITVLDKKDNSIIFNGWLVSNNPSISTIEHPVYEIILQECISDNKISHTISKD